ncbi:MAG: sigma-70 family RNA polymerase sigma factor [Microcella sp.]|uniref:RNA polymerase sigma factor n=1 Tax=Microcella sp. TaxID=1913979 RepID=UPI00271EE8DF|nr:sigma-70 family RNA polymerase sigma factor [Microcella sp.]MDO8336829.1 sigma-70 family RNA polymerase sigma factor [Microcella sp.]
MPPVTPDEFAAVYARHLPAVSAYLARRVERDAVDDLAADVFAVAWRKRETVTEGEELPWLYRIASYMVANHRRRHVARSNALAVLAAPDSAPSTEDIVLGDLALARAWEELRPRDREVLALAVLEDIPVNAIAVALAITPNAVSVRLHRAKKALAEALERAQARDAGDAPAPPRH